MKAIQIRSYGGSDQMKLEEAPSPQAEAGQVLVRIHGAGVNPVDWKIREGLRKQMHTDRFPMTLGQDFAGEVLEAGDGVTEFGRGDRVFGFASGSYAELAAVPVEKIARVPEGMDYVTAASIPTAGLTAFQILAREIQPRRGDSILIHGAAGGVGSFAVQIAKHFGARVIANASGTDEKYLRSIGADAVIDYHARKFENVVHDLDAVIDLVGGDVCERSYAVVKRGGVLVTTTHAADPGKAEKLGIRAVNFLMKADGGDLAALARLVENGAVKPRIYRVFPLGEARDAQDLNQQGRTHGKVVLEIVRN